jgi:hypothetical protein
MNLLNIGVAVRDSVWCSVTKYVRSRAWDLIWYSVRRSVRDSIYTYVLDSVEGSAYDSARNSMRKQV